MEVEAEQAVRAFLAKQLDDGAKYLDPQSPPLQTLLRDGVDLCRLVNKALKVPVRYHSPASHPYKSMDNISKFIASCAVLGVQGNSFEVADLHQNKNFPKVLATLKQLIRTMSPTTAVPPSPRPSPRSSSSVQQPPSVPAATTPAPKPEEWDGVRTWLAALLNDSELGRGAGTLVPRLKSGVLLCRLAEILQPGSVPATIYTGRVSFLQAQNIELYLRACAHAGVPQSMLFDPGDLQFERNVPRVMTNILEVARRIAASPTYKGPKPPPPKPSQQQAQQASATVVSMSAAIDPAMPGGRDFEKAAGLAPQTAEETTLLEWANALLRGAGEQPLRNLGGDCRTGVKLIKLACTLTKGRPLAPWTDKPTTLRECDRNAAVLFEFLQQQLLAPVPESTCLPRDVAAGRTPRVSALLTLLRDRFDADYHYQEILAAAAAATPSDSDELSDYGGSPGVASAPSSRPQSPIVVVATPPLSSTPPKRVVLVAASKAEEVVCPPSPTAKKTVVVVAPSDDIPPPAVPPPPLSAAPAPAPTITAEPIDIASQPAAVASPPSSSPPRALKASLALPPPPPPPEPSVPAPTIPVEPALQSAPPLPPLTELQEQQQQQQQEQQQQQQQHEPVEAEQHTPRQPLVTAVAARQLGHQKSISIDISGMHIAGRPTKPLPPPPPPKTTTAAVATTTTPSPPQETEPSEPAPLAPSKSLPLIIPLTQQQETPLPAPEPALVPTTEQPVTETTTATQQQEPQPHESPDVEGSDGHSKSSSSSSSALVASALGQPALLAANPEEETALGTPKLWHFARPGEVVPAATAATVTTSQPFAWESAPASSSSSGSVAQTASPRLSRATAQQPERVTGHRRRPSAPPTALGTPGTRALSASTTQLPSPGTATTTSKHVQLSSSAGGDLMALGRAASQLSLHRDRSGASAPPPTFTEMMASPVLRRQFQDFLEERHASENMQFLCETANFARHEMPHQEMLEEATRIYSKFCKPDAPSEVNLSGANRAFLQQLFRSGDASQITSKLFSKAHTEMAGMLQSSLFEEWIRQPIDWASARAANSASLASRASGGGKGKHRGLLATLRIRPDVSKAQNLIRLRTVTELLRSEERYVQALGTCKQHLAKPGASRSLDGGDLSQEEIGGVFSSFACLHFHHKHLCDALRERVALWGEGSTVGDVFLEHSRIFEDYYSYVRQYANALARLHTVITLRRPLRDSRMLRLGDLEQAQKLDATLEQYVMLPTQRLPQYLFTLMQLLRYTAKTHGDYGLLHQAAAETRKAVERVMEIIDSGAAPHTHKLLAIAASIDGRQAELLVVPRRRFVREGPLASVALTWRASSAKPTSTTTVRRPYLFLFEDLLVCCETGSRDPEKQYTFVAQLELPDIRAIHVNHALVIELSLHLGIMRGATPAFGGVTSGPVTMLSCVLRAQKEEERFLWEADISRLVGDARTRFRRGLSNASATAALSPMLPRESQSSQSLLPPHRMPPLSPRQSALGDASGCAGDVAATAPVFSPVRATGRPSHAPAPLPPVPSRERRASATEVPDPASTTAITTAAATTTTTTTAPSSMQYESCEGSASAAECAATSTQQEAEQQHNRKPSYESCEAVQLQQPGSTAEASSETAIATSSP